MSFEWHPDEPPPYIEAHSKAKLTVLRSYLRAYLDRLNVNPQRQEFKLDLIDGFAGGGTFLDGDTVVSGTPLVMLEETATAKDRLNEKRVKQHTSTANFTSSTRKRPIRITFGKLSKSMITMSITKGLWSEMLTSKMNLKVF